MPDAADSPEHALAQARRAEAEGDRAAAIRWFGRAVRVTDGDPTTVLLLAEAQCRTGPRAAEALLEQLLTRVPFHREGWLALLAVRLALREDAAAAAGLDRFLQMYRPPPDRAFRLLADTIAGQVAAPGWMGLDVSGRLTVSPSGIPLASLTFALDEAVMAPGFAAEGDVFVGACPGAWRGADRLVGRHGPTPLLGSGMRLALWRDSRGFVEFRAGEGLVGQAWLPADPAVPPALRLVCDGVEHPVSPVPAGTEFDFAVDAARLAGVRRVRVLSESGRDLWGSPLDPFAEQAGIRDATRGLARAFQPVPVRCPSDVVDLWRPLPVRPFVARPAAQVRFGRPRERLCHVVIPVHDGHDDLRRCLASLRVGLPGWARIIVVDDASTDASLCRWLDTLAEEGQIRLVRHEAQRGFPGAVASGLAATGAVGDVVLLNSDTMVAQGWLRKLSQVAYAAADIGSVTPLSQDGSLVSAEDVDALGEIDGIAAVAALDRICGLANPRGQVEIPTAVGFCMYIRRDCLEEVGGFRDDVFAQGYGEENDWCMRARALGWRHVAATGAFVAHFGGRSFGVARPFLIARNLAILETLHPGYAALVQAPAWRLALRAAWRPVHERLWQAAHAAVPAMLLVSHAEGGGVGRYIEARRQSFQAAGMVAFVLRPDGENWRLTDGQLNALSYRMPAELDALVAFLRGFRLQAMEIHHLLGHDLAVTGLAGLLGVPLAITIHDYGFWCPRFNLVTGGARYCGEPVDSRVCDACIADFGTPIAGFDDVAAHRDRARLLLAQARSVTVPSADVQRRFARQFPHIVTTLRPWEAEPPAPAAPRPATADVCRVVVVGAIGPEKGFDILLACARDAAWRGLALRFLVVGFTVDDRRLLDTGTAFVTGRYEEAELAELVRGCDGSIGLLPSIWPETWCFALSALLEAGLDVAAFDIGTQAERITRSGRGFVLPLGSPAGQINDVLMSRHAAFASREDLAVGHSSS